MRFDKAFAPVQERISLVLMFTYNGVPCRFQIARTHKIFPISGFFQHYRSALFVQLCKLNDGNSWKIQRNT